MISIVRRYLTPAVRQRFDRARESLRDPRLQTALATVVACLELLVILLWIEVVDSMASFGWRIFSYVLLFILFISPLWPSSIIKKCFKDISSEHISIAYWVFGIPIIIAYVFFIL